jgi:Rrf2 family protein
MSSMARPTNTQFAVAVHALTLLASTPDRLQSSEEMALSVGANPVHMRRVLGRLRTLGIVDSRPGPNGGWRLRRDPATLRLGDIWRAVDGDGHILGLHEANPDCSVGRQVQSVLRSIDRSASDAFIAELDRTTIAHVIATAERPAAAASA